MVAEWMYVNQLAGDIIFVMSSHSSIDKLQTIRQKFIKDDDQIAQKSRFGYFSLTPSCFLNHSINSSSHDQNHISKPQTEKRNIFAGVTATGVLKKSYFSYVPSYNSGDVYLDPSKRENLCKIKEIEKKESFKPSNCTQVENFTLSYKYMSDPVKKIDPSQLKDERGKVKIGKANIMCSTNDRCEQQRNKIYLRETKSEKKLIKMEVPQLKTKDNKPSFKVGIFKNKQFSTGKDIYGSIDKLPIQKQQTKKQLKCHQNQFKPQNRSSSGPYDLFTKVSYFSGQIREQPPKKQLKKQGFFLGSRYQISKPCPSVSLSKLNLLRSLR